MKTKLCLSAWCLAGLTAAALAGMTVHADTEDTIQKSFAVTPGGTLVIDADRGNIEVNTGVGAEASITVQRAVTRGSDARARQILDDHKVEIAQDGNTLTVRARLEGSRRRWGWSSPNLQVRYIVSLPKQFNVDLKTAGGGIKIGPLEGTLKAATSGGNVSAEAVEGPVTARTSGGHIDIGAATGAVMVRTSGGDIRLGTMKSTVDAETSGGNIAVKHAGAKTHLGTSGGNIALDRVDAAVDAGTSGGNVRVAFSGAPAEDCVIRTSGGNIRLSLPEGISANIDVSTSGGSVKSDLPVTVQGEIKRTALVGKIGDGGRLIKARTSGGSIYLEKASW